MIQTEKITAEVTELENRTTDKGKEYLRVKINNDWASCWSSTQAEKISQGNTYEFEIEQRGDFKNIITATHVLKQPPGHVEPAGRNTPITDTPQNTVNTMLDCHEKARGIADKLGYKNEDNISKIGNSLYITEMQRRRFQ